MAYMREQAPSGETVSLRAIFRDPAGNPVDPDSVVGPPITYTLTLYIYDETATAATIQAAIDADDYSGAAITVTSSSLTRISTGFFEYLWAIPEGTDTGTWHDVWVCEINGVEAADYFAIEVVETPEIEIQTIGENTLIVIVLDSSIAGDSGNTLEDEVQLSFSTRYNPYYASTDLVRLECGSWIDGIPGDTLALMIHWSSISADAYVGNTQYSSPRFQTARTKFVIFDAALRSLVLPANLGGKTKSLGDLFIKNDSNFEAVIADLKWEREQWARVMNAGGQIVPGQSLAPDFGVKGTYDPDRRKIGRLWAKPEDYNYQMPMTNTKSRWGVLNRRYLNLFRNR